ncbi:membrane-associated protein, putative [Bodo saltans]|uniref:Membrane-associated protein, putative n=1 Tax=Bodo saltans TaxID=75058 RepID=A0A0S4IK82_BODSA|nr:membrane-associated protein, putative [Bodo saltans]|eukprot:CUE62047.1 membrane-associated protein, putative [Bodo saltans]
MSAASTPGSEHFGSHSQEALRGARKGAAAVDISNVDISFDDATTSSKQQTASTNATVIAGMKLPLDEKAKLAEQEELTRKQVAEGQDPFFSRRGDQQRRLGGFGFGAARITGASGGSGGATVSAAPRPWQKSSTRVTLGFAGKSSTQQQLSSGAPSSSSLSISSAAPPSTSVPTSSAPISLSDKAADELMAAAAVAGQRETKFERSENFRIAMQKSFAATCPPLWQQLTDPSTTVPTAGGATALVEPWDLAFEVDVPPPATTSHGTPSSSQRLPLWLDIARCHNLLHHPIIPVHGFIEDERRAEVEATTSGGMKMIKTKEEIRAERRKAAQEKLEAARKEAAAKKAVASSSSNGQETHHEDQLRWKNLTDASRVQQLINDPHALQETIEQQYRERYEKHMRENYNRHVEALPQQAAKKISDMWRKAEERPRIHVYRVQKARNVHCVNRLRNFANDSKLRGFFLWIAEEELLVVLAGGDVAMRHLDRWIVEKMEWHRAGRLGGAGGGGGGGGGASAAVATDDEEQKFLSKERRKQAREGITTNNNNHDDADGDLLQATKLRRIDPTLLEKTQGELVLSLPLLRVGDVSFLLPSRPNDVMQSLRRKSEVDEAVFVRHCETVEAARAFLEELPAGGVVPSLLFAWHQTFAKKM